MGEEVRQLQQLLAEASAALAAAQGELLQARRGWEQERSSLCADYEARLQSAAQERRAAAAELAGLKGSIQRAAAPIVAVDTSGALCDWNAEAAEVFGCGRLPRHPPTAARGGPPPPPPGGGPAPSEDGLAPYLHEGDRASFVELQGAVLGGGAAAAGRPREPGAAAGPGPAAGVGASARLAGAVGPLQRRLRTRPEPSAGGPRQQQHREVLLGASPRVDAEGQLQGALYVGQETTALGRSLAQAELAAQDLAQLIGAVNAPLISVDVGNRIVEFNKKAEVLTGYSRDEAMGEKFADFLATEEQADSVRAMLGQGLLGQEITNFEFTVITKSGQTRELLWSTVAQTGDDDAVVGVVGIGQDITELRSESKMLANYVRICGAAVWSLRGNAKTGAVTDRKTQEIEHLISEQAEIPLADPRMVLWRASFISILKTMCQSYWSRREEEKEKGHKVLSSSSTFKTDFAYEFSFEAPNGGVKWYRVQGHLAQELVRGSQFEISGSMQEVTTMLIDKVEGQRWQKWWNRMCHMVFDATLLVDTQEYRVLNAWGEEKVFGCQLQNHHPLLQIIRPDDVVSLKEAFNEVTFKGFERGRILHLRRPGSSQDMASQCFLLSADQENPNECMMGIRMQAADRGSDHGVSVLWDVAKPHPVLTLEDLARLKSGLKRSHRRPAVVRRQSSQRMPGEVLSSSKSLTSIPEDHNGEFEDDSEAVDSEANAEMDDSEAAADSEAEDGRSSKSSTSNRSKSSTSSKSSDRTGSLAGLCNSSPARSVSEEVHLSRRELLEAEGGLLAGSSFGASPKARVRARPAAKKPRPSEEPPIVNLKWAKQCFEINLNNFASVSALRACIHKLTGVPPIRQTLILAGQRMPMGDQEVDPRKPNWMKLRATVKRGQTLMMLGTVPHDADGEEAEGADGIAGTGSLSPSPPAAASGGASGSLSPSPPGAVSPG